MADHEHPDPLELEAQDELLERPRLALSEGGGRLVHDEDPGVEVDGARDGDRLALASRQAEHRVSQGHEARVDPIDDLAGRALHRGVVEGSVPGMDLTPDEEVRDRIEVVVQGEILVDGLDAVALRVAGVANADPVPGDVDRSIVHLVGAGKNLDERRLAGAVVADDADHLPGLDRDRDALDRVDTAERLVDVSHLDERWAARRFRNIARHGSGNSSRRTRSRGLRGLRGLRGSRASSVQKPGTLHTADGVSRRRNPTPPPSDRRQCRITPPVHLTCPVAGSSLGMGRRTPHGERDRANRAVLEPPVYRSRPRGHCGSAAPVWLKRTRRSSSLGGSVRRHSLPTSTPRRAAGRAFRASCHRTTFG